MTNWDKTNWTLFSEIRVDKLNIIQWDNGWQTVDHKTLFSEIRVDKLNIIQWDKGWQIVIQWIMVDKNIIQRWQMLIKWDLTNWTLFSEIMVDKLLTTKHYSVR